MSVDRGLRVLLIQKIQRCLLECFTSYAWRGEFKGDPRGAQVDQNNVHRQRTRRRLCSLDVSEPLVRAGPHDIGLREAQAQTRDKEHEANVPKLRWERSKNTKL